MKILRLEGAIGDVGNTSEDLQLRLDELQLGNEELNLIINSPGGSVIEGFAIYNKLKALPNKITVKVEGLAASIATLIALAADKVEMSEVSLWMVHRASTLVQGNKEELAKQIEVLETIDNTLVTVYAEKTGMERKEIENIISKETFYDSQQALDAGFIDEIVDRVDAKMAAHYAQLNNKYMSKLSEFFAAFKADAVEEIPETPEAVENQDDTLTLESLSERMSNLDSKVDTLTDTVNGFVTAMADDESNAQDVIEGQVEAKFKALIASLPKTKGTTPSAADNGLNADTPSYVPKFAAFKAKMSEINKNTRKV